MIQSHYEKYRKKKTIEIPFDDVPDILSKEEYPSKESLNSNNSRELSIKIHWPLFYAFLNKKYPSEIFSWKEKMWCFYHNIEERPVCEKCGNPVKFHTSKGFAKFCSARCSNDSEEKKRQISDIKLERYGNKGYIHKEKRDQTKLERYGDKNFNNRKKALQTIIDKGGEGFGNASKEACEKQKQTCLKRYGIDNVLKDKEIHQRAIDKRNIHINDIAQKISESHHNRFKKANPNLIDSEGYGIWRCKCPHLDCDKCSEKWYTINVRQIYYRSQHNMEMCTRLLPIQTDLNTGTSIEMVVRDILDEYNIEYETNNRSVLNGKEIDIYIPSKRIAIECNGCYWHSTLQKPQLYHFYKWQECKNQDIQLISLWEDQFAHKQSIVRNIILSNLDIHKTRIYARKCYIKEISNQDAFVFCKKYHLQGGLNSSVNLGLYYNNELTSVMTFGQSRSKNRLEGEWELFRYCTMNETQVVGGASKLFKCFIDKYNPKRIISFSSNDISDGGLYKKLGFEYINTTKSSYWYIKQGTYERFHRSTFTKDAIIKRGWKQDKEGWIESEVMNNHGYLQIYDSGQQKWVWNNVTS